MALTDKLTAIANAIRSKFGTSGKLSLEQMANTINNISTKGATTYGAKTSAQTIDAGQYLSGAQTIAAVTQSNLSAANIVKGKTVTVKSNGSNLWNVTGTADQFSFTVMASQTPSQYKQTLTVSNCEVGKKYLCIISSWSSLGANKALSYCIFKSATGCTYTKIAERPDDYYGGHIIYVLTATATTMSLTPDDAGILVLK